MIIIDINSKPQELETCKVYVPDGYSLSETYAEELSDGTVTPLDLTTVLPIIYTVKKYGSNEDIEKVLPAGETNANGLEITGANNDKLTISVTAAELANPVMITHNHYLEITFGAGCDDIAWFGSIEFRNLFST